MEDTEPSNANFARAHLWRLDANGCVEHIRGPFRANIHCAEEDLHTLRNTAENASHTDDVQHVCDHLHELACEEQYTYPTYVHPPTYGTLPSGIESNEFDASSDDGDDFGASWQDNKKDGQIPDSEPSNLLPALHPTSVAQATALLAEFRFSRRTVDDLKRLLDSKADANVTSCGSIHPLMKVLTFAHNDKVQDMRNLLLGAGAIEDCEIQARYQIWLRAHACENAWLRRFHEDPR